MRVLGFVSSVEAIPALKLNEWPQRASQPDGIVIQSWKVNHKSLVLLQPVVHLKFGIVVSIGSVEPLFAGPPR